MLETSLAAVCASYVCVCVGVGIVNPWDLRFGYGRSSVGVLVDGSG